jgi:hypothetical protein
MIKTIAIAALAAATLATTTPVTAEEAGEAKEDVCAELAELARDVMELRQDGVPLSQLMKIAESEEILRLLALDAYRKSRFGSKEYRDLAVTDFSDKWALACYNEREEPL